MRLNNSYVTGSRTIPGPFIGKKFTVRLPAMAPSWSLGDSVIFAIPNNGSVGYSMQVPPVLSSLFTSPLFLCGHCGLYSRTTHNPLPLAVLRSCREGILGMLLKAADWAGTPPSAYSPFSIQHAWNVDIMSNQCSHLVTLRMKATSQG